MSKVPLRSLAVLVLLVIAGCKSRDRVNPVAPAGCGNANHDTPVVCVDGSGSTISVIPDSVRVWNVGSSDHVTPPTIQWITRGGGGNLQIAMKDEGCVEKPDCNGKGHCGAKVMGGLGVGATAGTELKRCRYTVTLDGRVLDPDAVVVGCCSDDAPTP
jgi:hypothetical protein